MLRDWIVRATERWTNHRLKGRTVVFFTNGYVTWAGTIMGAQLDTTHGQITVVAAHATDGIVPVACDCGMGPPVIRFPLTDKMRWNNSADRYEVIENGLDRPGGQEAPRDVGLGPYGLGDLERLVQDAQRSEGPTQAAEAHTAPHRGPDRESPGRVSRGHDVSVSGQGQESGADHPSAHPVAGGEGPSGPLVLEIRECDQGLPDGVLVGVAPDQTLHIYNISQPPPSLPQNTIVWGNSATVEHYRWWLYSSSGNPNLN